MLGKSLRFRWFWGTARLSRTGLTAEHVLHARLVVVARVRQRPHNRVLIREPSESRQFLADVDAGDVRLDGAEFAANVLWCIGLQVEGIVLRRPAPEEDEDARVGS